MKKIRCLVARAKEQGGYLIALIYLAIATRPSIAMADGITGSKIDTGLRGLISDATKWLMIIAVPVTGLFVIYYLIRRASADEMDHKKWTGRITSALICFVVVELASTIISILQGYFG